MSSQTSLDRHAFLAHRYAPDRSLPRRIGKPFYYLHEKSPGFCLRSWPRNDAILLQRLLYSGFVEFLFEAIPEMIRILLFLLIQPCFVTLILSDIQMQGGGPAGLKNDPRRPVPQMISFLSAQRLLSERRRE